MKKKQVLFTLMALVALFIAAPVAAQEEEVDASDWGIAAAGFAIAVAAFGGALGQGRTTAAAISAIARNPSAGGDIRLAMILGLAFIESLVIYALIIALSGAGIF